MLYRALIYVCCCALLWGCSGNQKPDNAEQSEGGGIMSFKTEAETARTGLLLVEEGANGPSELALQYANTLNKKGFPVILAYTNGEPGILKRAIAWAENHNQFEHWGVITFDEGFWPIFQDSALLENAKFLVAINLAPVSPQIALEHRLSASISPEASLDVIDQLNRMLYLIQSQNQSGFAGLCQELEKTPTLDILQLHTGLQLSPPFDLPQKLRPSLQQFNKDPAPFLRHLKTPLLIAYAGDQKDPALRRHLFAADYLRQQNQLIRIVTFPGDQKELLPDAGDGKWMEELVKFTEPQ